MKPMATRPANPTPAAIRDLQALRRFLGPHRPEQRRGSRLLRALTLPRVFRRD